jgi:rhomboid family protein
MDPVVHQGVEIDHCHWCGGVFLDAGEMQKITGEPPREWSPASALQRHPRFFACPACQHRLNEREYGRRSGVWLDHCDRCGGVFLDADHVRLIRFRGRTMLRYAETPNDPSIGAKVLCFVTGMPIEISNARRGKPIVVWALVAINALVFLLEMANGIDRPLLDSWAIVPSVAFEPSQWYRFVTAMFLHAGVLHVAGNLYFLWTFGDDVEDQFGHLGFLLLYLVWGVIAGIVDAAIAHGSSLPRLGASGAISGVLGAYVILRPRAKLYMFALFVPLRIGAATYLLGWIVLQLVSGLLHVGGVAWWAHVSGFVAGIATAAWARREHVVETLPE